MRLSSLVLTIPVVCGCSLSPQDGSADVLGQVIQNSGQPLANTTVVIDCPTIGTSRTASSDSDGWYHANLSAPAPGSVRCVLAVPDLATPRIRLDTAIRFAPGGQLHGVQRINLLEAPAP